MTTNETSVKTGTASENGTEVFIPLDKLKKSPRNARKTPHSEAIIEAYAASIAAKGIFQNLVVEPELDGEGAETGFYFVSIGEGRRLAQLLRMKRKQIKKTEPIRCVVDTVNDAHEISLDENITREAMHPADQFEAFRELHEERGWGAEEIAARFGITAHVVRQRLRLGAVSPKLMQVYRDGELALEQLMAFAITDDHARQEQVFENLTYNRDPYIIRRELTRTHVAANDRRAIFIGAEGYMEAGGAIRRDLFTEDRGGFYEDAALLDRLVIEKLQGISETVRQAEGWKWADVHIDYPHANGLRRTYPQPVDLSDEDEAAFAAASDAFNRLTEEWDSAEELPDDVDQCFGELEGEIERIDALRHAYDPDVVSRGGVFVVLSHDGTARVERGFIRAEDEQPEPGAEAQPDGDGYTVNDHGEIAEVGTGSDTDGGSDEDAEDEGKPLSDLLIRDLTAHRTLGLRLALGEQPDIALSAVTHALAAQTFYQGAEAHCLEIRPTSAYLAGHADGIEDTAAGKALADRHGEWAADMPRDVADLWGFIALLDHASVMALFAHCASLTVNTVKQPWERKPRAHEMADRLATAVSLDMTAHWTPTVRTYLGRVTKAQILDAVREAASEDAVDRLSALKKQPMLIASSMKPNRRPMRMKSTAMRTMSLTFRTQACHQSKAKVLQNARFKYACRNCDRTGINTPVVTAQMPAQPLPGSIATASTLAFALVHKYVDGTPLYRVAQAFERAGVPVSRGALGHWVIGSSEKHLHRIYDVLKLRLRSQPLIHGDETTVQVLKEENRAATDTSYMWAYRSGEDSEQPIVLLDYQPGRGQIHPQAFLGEYRGILMSDGYTAWRTLEGATHLGCMAHSRRRFVEAFKARKKGGGPPEQALRFFEQLYRVERQVRNEKPDKGETQADCIRRFRQQHSIPVLNALKEWLDEIAPKVLPDSKLGDAVSYTRNQWDYLTRYTEDGRMPIDNNLLERDIRIFATGRKSWLFSDTVEGARASATVYSLMLTCRACGVEPLAWLRHVLTELPQRSEDADIDDLLPFNFTKAATS